MMYCLNNKTKQNQTKPLIAAAELYFPALKTSFPLPTYERPTVSKEKHYMRGREVFSSLSKVVMSQHLGKSQ